MNLKICYLWLLISLVSCTEKNISLYVGTYTSGGSEGIYQFQFNTETGELTNKQLAVKTINPSYITYALEKSHIYAVNETEEGSVSSFKIENDGTLTLLNNVPSNGSYPCHISINKNGTTAVVSNYGGGTVSLYSISNKGFLNNAFKVFNHNAQEKVSHAHSAQFFNNDLYVADLGRNAVYNYRVTNQESDFELTSPSIIDMPDNAGPRHFALSKDGQFIYIINEYANTVTSAKKVNNQFEPIENMSTLNENFKAESFCADIHLSKNEKFLYGSNRGENSIVVFNRDAKTGRLEKIQNIGVEGNWPRNFTLDPSGKFLLVANQKSDNISVFKIDQGTGKLTFLSSTELPSPVCLLF